MVARGILTRVSKTEAAVVCEAPLHELLDASAADADGQHELAASSLPSPGLPPPRLRVDKAELLTSFATCRGNLLRLLEPEAAAGLQEIVGRLDSIESNQRESIHLLEQV